MSALDVIIPIVGYIAVMTAAVGLVVHLDLRRHRREGRERRAAAFARWHVASADAELAWQRAASEMHAERERILREMRVTVRVDDEHPET